VNEEAGAKTNLAAIISALLVGLTLMFLTPLFFYLPKAILGAIIMVAVFGLIDFKYPKYLWDISKQDFLMFAVAFGFTLILGIKEGIGAGVLISLLMLIYRTTKPHIAVLGELPGTKDYRNVDRFEVIHVREDVLVMRHDAQLYFANIRNFIDTLKESIDAKGASLKLVVLHCGSISSIDATAIQSLEELIEELNHRNIGVYFSGIIEPVRDFLQRTGFVQLVGENHFFIDVPSAIEYLDHGARKHSKQQLSSAIQNNVFREKEV
jgi:SulP family sulfate permease